MEEQCHQPPGIFRPFVDPARCEGAAECVRICPFDVFEVTRIDAQVFKNLSLSTKAKIWIHGMRSAVTPNADACQACGLCVSACPEKAIVLRKID